MDENAAKLRERLKTETRPEHEELETRMAILSPELSKERYFEILKSFRSLHALIEKTLAGDSSELAKDYLAHRSKLALLDEDLAGATAPSISVPLAWMSDSDKLLGALYVIEGSTLGGQVVSKGLRALHPEIPVSYFSGYRTETGKMWQSFISRFSHVPLYKHDAVVSGAR